MTDTRRSLRHERLLTLLARNGSIGVDALASACGVSAMTIRRDLDALQAQGHLTRTHGGCVAQIPFVRELPFEQKMRQQVEAKSAIAGAAAALVGEAATVYVDTGTTVLLASRRLPADRELTVVTNNLRVALESFGHPHRRVLVPGGQLAARSPDLVGDFATEPLLRLRFDLALIGADAIDPATGEVSSADQPTAELARRAWQRAARVLVLADHGKFARRGEFVVGRLGGPASLVTDDGIDPAVLAGLRGAGIDCATATPLPSGAIPT